MSSMIQISKKFSELIRLEMTSRGIATAKRLSNVSNVSEKTVLDILNTPDNRRKQEDTIKNIAYALYCTNEDIEPLFRSREDAYSFLMNKYKELSSMPILTDVFKIDIMLVQLMRSDSEYTDMSVQWIKYCQYLESACKANNVSVNQLFNSYVLKTFFDYINNSQNILKIVIKENLSHLQFISGNSSISVNNPMLLWPCNCSIPGTNPYDCPIHSNRNYADIVSAFKNGFVQIQYQKGNDQNLHYSRYFWKNNEGLWPPSIDSFTFIKNIIEFYKNDDSIESILDVGSGTGFLGIEAALQLPYVKKVFLNDFTTQSHVFASLNAMLNEESLKQKNVTLTSTLGYSLNSYENNNHFSGFRFDLLICNPPYIPIPEEYMELRQHSSVSGLTLLKFILEHGSKYAKNVVLSFSDVCLPEIKPFLDEKNIHIEQIGEVAIVPFRLPTLIAEKKFFEKVLKQRVMYKEDSVYLYYHTIRNYRVIN